MIDKVLDWISKSRDPSKKVEISKVFSRKDRKTRFKVIKTISEIRPKSKLCSKKSKSHNLVENPFGKIDGTRNKVEKMIETLRKSKIEIGNLLSSWVENNLWQKSMANCLTYGYDGKIEPAPCVGKILFKTITHPF